MEHILGEWKVCHTLCYLFPKQTPKFFLKKMIFLIVFVLVNGIYDMICALFIIMPHCYESSILAATEKFMESFLHLSMFKDPKSLDPQMKRMLAYWIFTYGVIRVYAALQHIYLSPVFLFSNCILASVSYLIEAFCFKLESELSNLEMVQGKVYFVFITSMCLSMTLVFLP